MTELALRCDGVWRFTDTYLDGEFGEVERAEFEAHLESCSSCHAIVREQSAWKKAIRASAPRESAPDALRLRLGAALVAAESEKGVALVVASPTAITPLRRRSFVQRAWPYAAVATLVLGVVVSRGQHAQVTDDVIAKHQRNLPLEITGRSDDVRRWYADKVDFPVHPPMFNGATQVALRGGRLANVRDRQAAYLLYEVNGNRVSVFIFDPGELPMEARHHQMIGNREVYFDAERGYNVALYRDQGIGYAIASDVNQGEMLKLVSAAVGP